jgi:hypothetical protein
MTNSFHDRASKPPSQSCVGSTTMPLYEMHVGTGPATARISETSKAMMSWRRLEKATGCSGPPKLPSVLTAR